MKKIYWILLATLIAAAVFGVFVLRRWSGNSWRNQRLGDFFQNPGSHADWMVRAGQRCAEAPFRMPTSGYIGYIWGDSFRLGHQHQGIDIFGGSPSGHVEVRAALAGYLSRLPEWKSSLIVRVPDDPLQPGRQIWTYYTHLADQDGHSLIEAQFPAGTSEVYVNEGTLLGRMGNFSGDPGSPTGVHLHFSLVKDDGKGRFLNELDIANTYDPSPYLGLNLNASRNRDQIPTCPHVGDLP